MVKAILYLILGGAVGALLGYASQCTGGSCPLMCAWWRGAIFGAVAGLTIYFAGVPGSSKRNLNDSRRGRRSAR